MGIKDRINDIEAELKKTQKNKATEKHRCLLRARLAQLRTQIFNLEHKSTGKGEGYDVAKQGNARVAMIGFPSVGKSTMLNSLTETKSQVAAYEFTTLTCIPGIINYNDCQIQLLDLPGIIEGAAIGSGNGK